MTFAGGKSRAQPRTGDPRLDRALRELTDPNNLNATLEYDKNGRLGLSSSLLSSLGLNANGSQNGSVQQGLGNVFHQDVAGEIASLAEKGTISTADVLLGEDSDNGFGKAKFLVSAIGGMLGTVNKVVTLDLGAFSLTAGDPPTIPGWKQAHGITDWDKSKYSFVLGYIESAVGDIQATAPGVIVLPQPIGFTGLTCYTFSGDYYLEVTADLSLFQFNNAFGLIGYNTL